MGSKSDIQSELFALITIYKGNELDLMNEALMQKMSIIAYYHVLYTVHCTLFLLFIKGV